MEKSVDQQNPNFAITLKQAILGEKLSNCHHRTPIKLWEMLRAATTLLIWKARNEMVFTYRNAPIVEVRARIWHRMKQYIRVEWDNLLIQMHVKKVLSQSEGHQRFKSDFGMDTQIYCIIGNMLHIAAEKPTAVAVV
jgi:hypothetical protein